MKRNSPNIRAFVLAMALYAVLLVGSILVLRRLPEGPLKFIVALVPVLPGLYMARVIAREISRRDELQRRIQLEALAFAFAGTAVTALGIGLLENAGVPPLNGSFYVPIMAALWVFGQAIASRKYR